MAALDGTIFLTGGTGTLGRALMAQAQTDGWDCRFTVYSRSEALQAETRALYPDARYILGDVRDYDRLSAAIIGHDTVLHLAAHKRIPEAEAAPSECFATNVIGTANVLRACQQAGVKRCVVLSTDKACQATTTYGATKLLAESLVRAQQGPCSVTGVRYGNVLASRGSVIPLWQAQAARGDPITMTHVDMTRFWMTARDAIQLIIVALQMPTGLIVIGKPKALPVLDLARIVAPEAHRHYIGLRSLEKMHEALVHDDERVADCGAYYVLGIGATGHRYTSDTCPRLSDEEVRAMLGIAEAVTG